MKNAAIIDANINRASEGLRVIEEYCRFVAGHATLTERLSMIRKQINQIESPSSRISQLQSRDTAQDIRAKEPPRQRQDVQDLLTANFKRVTEALRVLEEYTGNATYNQCRYDVYDLEKQILLGVLKKEVKPGVYLISDDVKVLKKGLEWGVSLIQLRDKEADKSSLLERATLMAALAKEAGVPFIVNDFVDIALAVDADGVHTGQDDLSIIEQRQLLGPHKLIGRTTHSLDQGLKAQEDGADYVSVGPIWETPSKPGRAGIGFEYLERAKVELGIPYVAIGGVDLDNVAEVLSFKPPLIGLIRDFENVPMIQEKMNAITEE